MLSAFDESVGKIIAALHQKKILQNSVVLLLSDNGGATQNSPYVNTGSNWPLRGVPFSYFSDSDF